MRDALSVSWVYLARETDRRAQLVSGPLRDRINYLKVIVHDPDIFILDGAASYLNVLSEREIHRRMPKLAQWSPKESLKERQIEQLCPPGQDRGQDLDQG
ncbi:MAG: hypothetical protein OK474_07185 [Thaumarchaeota archaeon]|nr:hypothetical protein [Nitrososphaerota archaeon]